MALARAFAPAPRLLLADEPTGNLDAATGRSVMDLLFGMQAEHGTTLLLITHDAALAERCGRQVRIADGRVDAAAVDGVRLAWRLALRDLRGGLRGIRVVLACLALLGWRRSPQWAACAPPSTRGWRRMATAVPCSAGTSRSTAVRSRCRRRCAPGWRRAAAASPPSSPCARCSRSPSGERQLIELKAVDAAYPLVGAVTLDPAMPLAAALDGGVAADPLVLQRACTCTRATRVRIGQSQLVLRAALASGAGPCQRPRHPGPARADPRHGTARDRAGADPARC